MTVGGARLDTAVADNEQVRHLPFFLDKADLNVAMLAPHHVSYMFELKSSA